MENGGYLKEVGLNIIDKGWEIGGLNSNAF